MGDHLHLHRPAAIEKIAVAESMTKKGALHVHTGAAPGKHGGGTASSPRGAPAVPSAPQTAPKHHLPASPQACLCSPTTHAGSFRCRLHRGIAGGLGLGGSVGAGFYEMGKKPDV